ncbi:hypothetical protein DMUE_5737 [Dictyocoela muelleri]|nr:hypothetical protein EQH57_0257 [Dictyocoela roeselum]KAG0429548.1 hypothetical protein DMUE_5737 [Dictyocoela muelleri]
MKIPIDIIYLDFQKVLRGISSPTKRLLSKLHSIGIGGELSSWINYLLLDRRSESYLEELPSPWGTVTCSVPQGAVSGPVLLIILALASLQTELRCQQIQFDLYENVDWSDKW